MREIVIYEESIKQIIEHSKWFEWTTKEFIEKYSFVPYKVKSPISWDFCFTWIKAVNREMERMILDN